MKPSTPKHPKAQRLVPLKPVNCEESLLTQFVQNKYVGNILKTSTKPKECVFESLRPKAGHCLDYRISQTQACLDAGPTKINIRQIEATYVPSPEPIVPKEPKKVKLFSGGPPQWVFIDEKWRARQWKLQEQYKEELKENIRARKKHDKMKELHLKKLNREMVGPEWYQELSPNQLKAIDCLAFCISKDLSENTICYTQRIIAELGLVRMPNSRHFKEALKQCCNSPAEFLLVLYQLINPKRTEYSLNDRLLLSGVVHLTITNTLRELHIRIPSPPRKPKPVVKPPPKEKAITYRSPYLVPYTFKPDPPKFSGIYENKHLQYPESPYFSYIPIMKIEAEYQEDNLEMLADTLEAQDLLLIEEMKAAQQIYDNLVDCEIKPKLLKPTIIKLCEKTGKLANLEDAFLDKMDKHGHGYTPNQNKALSSSAVEVEETLITCKTFILAGVTCVNGKAVPIISGVSERILNDDKRHVNPAAYKKMVSCIEEAAPEDCFPDVVPRRVHQVPIITGIKLTRCGYWLPMIGGIQTIECPSVTSKCKKVELKFPSIPKTKLSECSDLEVHKHYIINGVAITKNGQKVPIISGVKEMLCTEVIKYEQDCVEDCKAHLDTFISQKCEKFEDFKRKYFAKYLITGIKRIGRNEFVPIIGGVKETKCECLEEYQESIKSYEYNKHLSEKKEAYKKMSGSFVISGIAITPNGPEYILSAVKPKANVQLLRKCINTVEQLNDFRSKKAAMLEENSKDTTRLQHILKHIEQSKYELQTKMDLNCHSRKCRDAQLKLESSTPKCDCYENYLEKLTKHEAYIRGKLNRLKFIADQTKYSISGVNMTSDGPVYVLGQVSNSTENEKYGECLNYISQFKDICNSIEPISLVEKKEDIKEQPELDCSCKKELQRVLTSSCPCEKCVEDYNLKHATFIVAGTKPIDSGHAIPIMSGIYDKNCSCLHNYEKKMQRFEAYKHRIEARYQLKKASHKFVIGGVMHTAQGPVYNISGIRPEILCKCGKKAQAEEAEAKRLAMLPKAPKCYKYNIGGVKETKDGSVYILSNALPQKDCACMDLYNRYDLVHSKCMETYEQYLQQTEKDIEEYLNDLEMRQEVDQLVEISMDEYKDHYDDHFNKEEEEDGFSEELAEEYSIFYNKDKSEECGMDLSEYIDRMREILRGKVEDGDFCTCMYDDDVDDFEPPYVEVEETKDNEFRRYVILDKFPRCYRKQMELLKYMLERLAEDGFPLAKLPDCHKLPIFKLWLQLRSGKFWTQKDKLPYWDRSLMAWHRLDTCRRKVEIPKLPITSHRAITMTWNDAAFCRKIVSEAIEDYYRKLKQSAVDVAREWFPTTFSYEFPTKSFRDCFFAYCPAKEANVFPFKIVKEHEMVTTFKRKVCKL